MCNDRIQSGVNLPKNNMKPVYFILGICLVSFLITGCRKNKSYMVETAVITGYDGRYCGCCGGLMINFNDNPNPYEDAFSLIRELPDNAGIDHNTSFPVYVKVNYKEVSTCTTQKLIEITKITRR
jgi:hypothetical protein